MRIIYPRIALAELKPMLVITLLAGLFGGLYGILHDQVSFTLSPEYFTKLKYHQFDYLDFGYPDRVYVSEIGFLAASATALIPGWFLARVTVPVWPPRIAVVKSLRALVVVFAVALIAAPIGYALGLRAEATTGYWQSLCQRLDVQDCRAFVTVAYIHYAGHFGGLLGLVGMLLYMRRAGRREADNASRPAASA